MRLPFDVPTIAPPPPLANPLPPPAPPRVAPPQADEAPATQAVVRFVRHPRARRYLLRVQPDGSVRVTIPRRGSRREGEAFLQRSRAWVDRQQAKLASAPSRRGLGEGDVVLLGGIRTPIRVDEVPSRVTVRVGSVEASSRSPADVRVLVTRALRAHAERVLPLRLHGLAAGLGLHVRRVSIRNQKGRWGSCSPTGTISLNWRLVQMPPEVCDYVLVHELMHVREPNHSRRFWKHVAQACPWHLEARRWLTREGRALL
jgi:hypothetical protein